jgi:hypothetical protein
VPAVVIPLFLALEVKARALHVDLENFLRCSVLQHRNAPSVRRAFFQVLLGQQTRMCVNLAYRVVSLEILVHLMLRHAFPVLWERRIRTVGHHRRLLALRAPQENMAT